MKNYHIGCIVVLIVVALILSVYLGNSIKEKQLNDRKELLSDTARINKAHRTYEKIHHQILMEDSDYAALYRENQALKEEIKRLKGKVLLSP